MLNYCDDNCSITKIKYAKSIQFRTMPNCLSIKKVHLDGTASDKKIKSGYG